MHPAVSYVDINIILNSFIRTVTSRIDSSFDSLTETSSRCVHASPSPDYNTRCIRCMQQICIKTHFDEATVDAEVQFLTKLQEDKL